MRDFLRDRMGLADFVFDELSLQFMSGTRAPGSRLKINELAEEFSVSQTPIREALARLERTGFVERFSNKGYVVAPLLSEEALIDLMDARILMEPGIVEKAFSDNNPDFHQKLLATIDVMKKAGSRSDAQTLRDCWIADEEFHLLIVKQARNPFLVKAYESLGGQLQRFRIIGQSGTSHAQSACSEHEAVYESFVAGDLSSAVKAMENHLISAKHRAIRDIEVSRADELLTPPLP